MIFEIMTIVFACIVGSYECVKISLNQSIFVAKNLAFSSGNIFDKRLRSFVPE